jgi:hypothetical protein
MKPVYDADKKDKMKLAGTVVNFNQSKKRIRVLARIDIKNEIRIRIDPQTLLDPDLELRKLT